VLFEAVIGRGASSLRELDFGIPDEHYRLSRRALNRDRGAHRNGFIVKTHVPFLERMGYRRVSYIVRDPRDCIPSFYRYRSRKGDVPEFHGFARACLP